MTITITPKRRCQNNPLNAWMRERRIQKFPEFKYESFIWG